MQGLFSPLATFACSRSGGALLLWGPSPAGLPDPAALGASPCSCCPPSPLGRSPGPAGQGDTSRGRGRGQRHPLPKSWEPRRRMEEQGTPCAPAGLSRDPAGAATAATATRAGRAAEGADSGGDTEPVPAGHRALPARPRSPRHPRRARAALKLQLEVVAGRKYEYLIAARV